MLGRHSKKLDISGERNMEITLSIIASILSILATVVSLFAVKEVRSIKVTKNSISQKVKGNNNSQVTRGGM